MNDATIFRFSRLGLTALTLLTVAACSSGGGGDGGDNGGSDDPPDPDLPEGVEQRRVDASDSEAWVYIDLATGDILELDAADAAESTAWHVALRRFNIAVNGGTSGPGSAAGGLIAPQDDFYDDEGEPNASVFLNATAEDYLDLLMNDDFEEPEFVTDSITTVFGEDWYRYAFATGNITAEPDNGWLLRSGEGDSYARMRVTEIDFPTRAGQGVQGFEIAFDVQPAGVDQFTGSASFSGSIPSEGGSRCFDFDTDATVDCEGTAWDLQIGFEGREFFLRSNGGPSGNGDAAGFGPFAWEELADYGSATTDPSGESIAGLYQPDTSTGIFASESWYAYNLQGQHRLWPNYRVYLVDSDPEDDSTARFAVQVIDYYDGTGASGQPTIRWRQLEAE